MRTLAVIVFLVLTALPLRAETLTVFAAASLKNVFDAIGEAFTAKRAWRWCFPTPGRPFSRARLSKVHRRMCLPRPMKTG
jgi:hypothetical protein